MKWTYYVEKDWDELSPSEESPGPGTDYDDASKDEYFSVHGGDDISEW